METLPSKLNNEKKVTQKDVNQYAIQVSKEIDLEKLREMYANANIFGDRFFIQVQEIVSARYAQVLEETENSQ